MTSTDLQSSFTSLGHELRAEMAELEALRAGRQQDDRAAAQALQRDQEALFRNLLNNQVQDTQRKNEASTKLKYSLLAVFTTLLGGGSIFGVQNYSATPAPGAEIGVTKESARDAKIQELSRQLELQRQLIVRLGQIVSDQGVHTSDSVFYLGLKLDRVNNRAKRIEPPMTVKDAATAAMKVKSTRSPFTGYNPADPFGDLLRSHHVSR